jgi:hypothetical protein
VPKAVFNLLPSTTVMMLAAWMTTSALLVEDHQAWEQLDGEGILYTVLC